MSNEYKDYKVSIPEGRRATEFDPGILDGAKAALQLVDILPMGQYELEEANFRRDFLPIMIGQVDLTPDLEMRFIEAWKHVAGSIQTGFKVVKGGEYLFSVPPLISAHGALNSDPQRMGQNGIRIAVDVLIGELRRIPSTEVKMAMFEDAILNRLPEVKINPVFTEQWRKVLDYYGIQPLTQTAAVINKQESLDGFIEPGEEV